MRGTDRLAGVALGFAVAVAAPAIAAAQAAQVVAHTVTVSSEEAKLQLELTDGSTIVIAAAGGRLLVDGRDVGGYDRNSPLEAAWRETLAQAGRLSSDEVLLAVRSWDAEGESDAEAAFRDAIAARLEHLEVAGAVAPVVAAAPQAPEAEAEEHMGVVRQRLQLQQAERMEALQERLDGRLGNITMRLAELGRLEQLSELGNVGLQVENATVRLGDATIARDEVVENDLVVLGGDVSLFGRVAGNLVALDGDVILHRGGVVDGDVVSLNGSVVRAGGTVAGSIRSSAVQTRGAPAIEVGESHFAARNGTTLASLLGMFVALASIGFGLTFFMPRQLEVVSGTVTDSFGRSFFAGLFAQPLLVPAALITILGLVITVVGILLVPVAALVMALALGASAVGGYLAVARSLGGAYLARRMAQGHAVVATPYRSLLYGLAGLLAVWLPAAALGWIPLVGQVLAVLAGVFTWAMITAGFGAVILSRAGLRASFGPTGPRAALTDEHYWPSDTPLPPVRRASSRRP